jgi:succinylglutamic semialdehyde dehydrogenase
VSARLVPAAWDADPQPFIGGLISEQAALNVLKAWQDHVARGAKTCWSRSRFSREPRC